MEVLYRLSYAGLSLYFFYSRSVLVRGLDRMEGGGFEPP